MTNAHIHTQGATPRHTLYRSTHATNCNRLENEVVKWRSPCVWPLLISCNVVFYVMPCSPRTLCSLLRLINTLNQTVPLWHPWACVRVRITQDLFLCTTQGVFFWVYMWTFRMISSEGVQCLACVCVCVWLSECRRLSWRLPLFAYSPGCAEHIKLKTI